MIFELNQALSPGGLGRASKFLLRLLLSTTVAGIWPSALADDPTTVQQLGSAENSVPKKKSRAQTQRSTGSTKQPL
jgi:hypothetical protein